MSDWFYAAGGRQAGPVDDTTLGDLVRAGTVTGPTLVWRRGMANWQPYGELWAALRAEATGQPLLTAAGAGDFSGAGGNALALAPATTAVRCVECGGVYPSEETVPLHEGPVCARCKPLALQRLREGVPARTLQRYAGFWIRVGGSVLDYFIKLPVQIAFQVIYYFLFPRAFFGNGAGDYAPLVGVGVLNVANLLFELSYNVFFVGRFSATPGKMVCGLRVVRTDGTRLTYPRALGRALGKWLSGLTLCIGYLLVAFDDQRRALHDHLADTRVVFK